jgi:hypothetical protein
MNSDCAVIPRLQIAATSTETLTETGNCGVDFSEAGLVAAQCGVEEGRVVLGHHADYSPSVQIAEYG